MREKIRATGREVEPVEISGRTITRTFWGKAWCKNLESYSDYGSRLPRGRTYARRGAVLDLHIEEGRIDAVVSGSRLYDVRIRIDTLAEEPWASIRAGCSGRIDSVVELLEGRLSKGVMEVVTRPGSGLFPAPSEIELQCSCPDWAVMCKHVAATLYGVGARLDHAPELLFSLRGVDPSDLLSAVIRTGTAPHTGRGRVLQVDDLAAVFGVEIDFAFDPEPDEVELTVRVVDHLVEGSATVRALADALDVDEQVLGAELIELEALGVVYRTGSKGGALWSLG